MTDYHPLIARAVEGLDASTGETRRALYERARTALVTQLRSVEPPLSETEITKERLALEDAIRKVEADVARKSRAELRPAASPPRRDRASSPADAGRAEARGDEAAAPPPIPEAAAQSQAPRTPAPTARERLLSARTPPARESISGFRGTVNDVNDFGAATAKSAQFARETRDLYGPGSSRRFPPGEDSTASSTHGFEPQQLEADELSSPSYNSRRMDGHEASFGVGDDHGPLLPQYARHPAHTASLEEEHQPSRFPSPIAA